MESEVGIIKEEDILTTVIQSDNEEEIFFKIINTSKYLREEILNNLDFRKGPTVEQQKVFTKYTLYWNNLIDLINKISETFIESYKIKVGDYYKTFSIEFLIPCHILRAHRESIAVNSVLKVTLPFVKKQTKLNKCVLWDDNFPENLYTIDRDSAISFIMSKNVETFGYIKDINHLLSILPDFKGKLNIILFEYIPDLGDYENVNFYYLEDKYIYKKDITEFIYTNQVNYKLGTIPVLKINQEPGSLIETYTMLKYLSKNYKNYENR